LAAAFDGARRLPLPVTIARIMSDDDQCTVAGTTNRGGRKGKTGLRGQTRSKEYMMVGLIRGIRDLWRAYRTFGDTELEALKRQVGIELDRRGCVCTPSLATLSLALRALLVRSFARSAGLGEPGNAAARQGDSGRQRQAGRGGGPDCYPRGCGRYAGAPRPGGGRQQGRNTIPQGVRGDRRARDGAGRAAADGRY